MKKFWDSLEPKYQNLAAFVAGLVVAGVLCSAVLG